jgi:hypothetical protein
MMPAEREKLLALFGHEQQWCQNAEACDSEGNPVQFDDAAAVAWDITGGLCRLFGWQRARVLFAQLQRHINGRRRSHWYHQSLEIESMLALQDYNDRPDTSFGRILKQLATMPVWRGKTRVVEGA